MPSFTSIAAVAAFSAGTLVSAHGTISGVVSGGKWYSGTSPNWIYGTKPDTAGWYAQNQDNGFVGPDSYGNGDIDCHKSATVGGTPIPVAAGDTIDLEWTTWPESHHGPVITYMAPVSGTFAAVDKASLSWFKVAEGGLIDGSTAPGVWASDQMIANNGTATFTVPSSLKAGNYVVRNEIIALHSAGSSGGAQNYPQCLNVVVSGSGTSVPSGVVGTALYKATDPGILINIYQSLSSYTIPGPALGVGRPDTSSSVVSPVPTSVVSSSAAPNVTSVPSSSAAPNATTVLSSSAAPVATSVPSTMVTSLVTSSAAPVATPIFSSSAAPVATAPATPGGGGGNGKGRRPRPNKKVKPVRYCA